MTIEVQLNNLTVSAQDPMNNTTRAVTQKLKQPMTVDVQYASLKSSKEKKVDVQPQRVTSKERAKTAML